MAARTELSEQQAKLMSRVALKRFDVRFFHYVGGLHERERVVVVDTKGEFREDDSFRSTTADSLRRRGLITYQRSAIASDHVSTLKPTREGLKWFLEKHPRRSADARRDN